MEQLLYSHDEVLRQSLRSAHLVKKKNSCSSEFSPTTPRTYEDLIAAKQDPLHNLQKHELLAYETFIHEDVTPGFRYRVKENGSNKALLDGKARYLEHVGQGYGKRLTFESDEVLVNENFFWTDSNLEGYAFSIEAISVGDIFVTKLGETKIGFATITKVDENQEIISSEILDEQAVKRVKVDFECKMSEKVEEESSDGQMPLILQGIVTVTKRKDEGKCRVMDMKVLSLSGTQVSFLPVSMN